MMAADSSTWIAYSQGGQLDSECDLLLLDEALADRQVLMVPVVPLALIW